MVGDPANDLGKLPAVANAGVQDPPDVPGKKLGKLDAKFLKGLPVLGVYTAQLPLPPGEANNGSALQRLGMMANDTVGDCTAVTVGHAIETWTSLTSTEIVLSDATILALYSNFGYVIGDPNTDNGAVLSDVLAYWYKNPVAGHALNGFASIRPGNRTSIRDAIYLFGVCALGVQLPLSAQQTSTWVLPEGQSLTEDWEPGSWGGHAIPAVAYDENGVTVVSWGKLMQASWNWLDAYMDEAYGLLSKDWMMQNGNSPPGFDWAALETDMNSLRVSP
jgi:hypothetical protein